MAGRKKAPMWRQAFLRGLRRTGNVRVSAFEAGVDPGTAYDHRAKDPGFAAKWGEAKTAYRLMATKRRAGGASGTARRASGSELVLRRTKHGDAMVRASPGRWSRRIEESFLDGLEATGCVRTAARAAGISTSALYERRDHYPEFRARWEERAGRAGTQLPGLLSAAAVASLSPDPAGAKRRGRARLPKVTVAEAIRIAAIEARKQELALRPGRKAGLSEPPASQEEAFAALERELDILEGRDRKRLLSEGWTEAEDGTMIPPGWIRAPGPPEPPDQPSRED